MNICCYWADFLDRRTIKAPQLRSRHVAGSGVCSGDGLGDEEGRGAGVLKPDREPLLTEVFDRVSLPADAPATGASPSVVAAVTTSCSIRSNTATISFGESTFTVV